MFFNVHMNIFALLRSLTTEHVLGFTVSFQRECRTKFHLLY